MKVSEKLINRIVLQRLEKAESEGDVELLREHLKSNYDVEVHSAVYEAFLRMGIINTEKNKILE